MTHERLYTVIRCSRILRNSILGYVQQIDKVYDFENKAIKVDPDNDFYFYFQAMRVYQTLDSNPWHNSVGGNNRLFDFPGVSSSANDWGMGLFATQQSLYGSLAQQ